MTSTSSYLLKCGITQCMCYHQCVSSIELLLLWPTVNNYDVKCAVGWLSCWCPNYSTLELSGSLLRDAVKPLVVAHSLEHCANMSCLAVFTCSARCCWMPGCSTWNWVEVCRLDLELLTLVRQSMLQTHGLEQTQWQSALYPKLYYCWRQEAGTEQKSKVES